MQDSPPNAPEHAGPALPAAVFAPLADPVFRMLYSVWIAANVCMAMSEVAAAWLMTSLTTSPVMVALVQTAATMPVFLLGLPSGALADILDRRRFLAVTQFWVAGAALLLCLAIVSEAINPTLLLVLVFINGIGLAMRWPVYAAMVPELVPRVHLPAALALNGLAMNVSRIVGPVLAGALIASVGTGWVFVLNAALSVLAGLMMLRWKSEPKTSALPGERFFAAMRLGVQYVRQSGPMRAVLIRVTTFFAQSTALIALLPLIARGMEGGSAGTYTLLFASMGCGAIASVFVLPWLRQRRTRDQLIRDGSWLQAAAMVAIGFAPNVYVGVPVMVVAGMAWLTVANAISVSAQLALPNWVRARGMSTFQVALMGSAGIGAALWGRGGRADRPAHRSRRGGRRGRRRAVADAELPGRGRRRRGPDTVAGVESAGHQPADRTRRGPGDDDHRIPHRPGACRRVPARHGREPQQPAAPGSVVLGAVPRHQRCGPLSRVLRRRILGRAPAALRPGDRGRRGAARAPAGVSPGRAAAADHALRRRVGPVLA